MYTFPIITADDDKARTRDLLFFLAKLLQLEQLPIDDLSVKFKLSNNKILRIR